MKNALILLALLLGCSQPKVTKKYVVMSVFNDVMLETNDKAQAYETAHELTMMGRVFQSKPYYFVIEK